MNRLAEEKSPYLLQHADNPVDWYPWGEEAFEAAEREDKPIFLSIGYSTCHWCHVMEHESFQDSATAALMNEYFISIKVDREERPDIDNIYMTVCQTMTGRGGWPLTILMTPDKKPFFAGTYFPRETRFNQMGMKELIPKIGDIWRNDRGRLADRAESFVDELKRRISPVGTDLLDEEILNEAFTRFSQRFDEDRGGFQGRTKFPTAHNLSFLLRYWKRTGDSRALHMVEKTLKEMRWGGIYDHVGFGFHRYATDPEWLVPHFEKMLYDQAMNAIAYLEAYQATGKEAYANTARETFAYVLRDMTSPEGGFYSAEDADSEGEEGKFYLWTLDEIESILGHRESSMIAEIYNISENGNFREEASGQKRGKNIVHLQGSTADLAAEYGLSESELRNRLNAARENLFQAREKRVHPFKDDKILTDWNGLMIAALAKGGRILGNDEYAHAARSAADFILDVLKTSEGYLLKRYRDGVASLPAHLEDYAFMVWGLLELYETTFEVSYLQQAVELTDTMIALFWDEEEGGFFFTSRNGEELIVRTKEVFDGAIPSGNSVAALDLLRIGRITGRSDLEEKAAAIGKVFSSQVKRYPPGHSQLLLSVDFGLGPSYEIVIVGDLDGDDTARMLQVVRAQFLPNKVVLLKSSNGSGTQLAKLAPFTETQVAVNGNATAYVCQNYTCDSPTTDPDEMLNALR
ncbi:MAG: thioredoxin domain-containing protein [Candidatus Neomarinimicrobiota bacterium]